MKYFFSQGTDTKGFSTLKIMPIKLQPPQDWLIYYLNDQSSTLTHTVFMEVHISAPVSENYDVSDKLKYSILSLSQKKKIKKIKKK